MFPGLKSRLSYGLTQARLIQDGPVQGAIETWQNEFGFPQSAYAEMKYRRFTSPRTLAIAGLILLSLTGCKYDRSFLNMDSNSGSPFFGLQLAVDSGSRPPASHEKKEDTLRAARPSDHPAVTPHRRTPRSASQAPMLFTRAPATVRNGLERTSDLRDLNTNVRYSLQAPATDESIQAQSIDLRLSSF